ncbi:ABC-2 type transport system ATP-binding protein [Micromonospora pattaloongensis]|uniref:ABC-2 type transport system ATP-binding protein n=1 Tax=Micromonospora pattaloongensis TaxID=405436 RepID=A0A1H3HX42_9ACTN|nr:ABC transporter ATP-binding protein [Micromonospora pattaloongensis]SDY20026.1 ABC-2 type transport system ATP-binding protein [Micromonospora pattaloongensis]
MAEPIIEARDLGIRFTRHQLRRAKLRELFIHGGRRQPQRQGFWPLRHVSFAVAPGEAVGVIGRNGTGKSTLLRLIAGALIPDEGVIDVRGRVAPLLELSAGFSNDLTGRENLYLVGSLHGLGLPFLRSRFEEIVAFAGEQVRQAIDTPVRHYSSGMKVRLGFAVIAQLPHPILLVDEVMAVGDEEFRAKCYATMERLLAEGRTLVLVSHNEADLTRFCSRGLYFEAGTLRVDGTVREALDAYRRVPVTPTPPAPRR